MTMFELTGPQFEEIRSAIYELLGLTLAQTFILVVLMLIIVGLLVAGIVTSRWYK